MKSYVIGLDYETNVCRAVILDLKDGAVVASHMHNYPSGVQGILINPHDPHVARQNPQDYLDGTVAIVINAVRKAKKAKKSFDPSRIIAIGIATTGSTPMPVDRTGTPLGMTKEFKRNLNAMAWLRKDCTAHSEAGEITALAQRQRPRFLAKCGGIYSSEWFWSKILHCKRVAPDVFNAAFSFVEHCDWMPAVLAGTTDPLKLKRSVCAAGHKAMYCDEWGGLPDKEFLGALDPGLADVRDRLYTEAVPSNQKAGTLCGAWARTLGLREGIPIAVGAFDWHMGAIGAGIKEGTFVQILGTSTCDIMIKSGAGTRADIPGICGIVKGSVMPGYYGIDVGHSAMGEILLWFVSTFVPDSYGKTQDAKVTKLNDMIAKMKPGESGLMALDWHNGSRSTLADARLSGILLGQTLQTKPHEIYRALIEATAFGALTIVKQVQKHGGAVDEIVNCGALAMKNPALLQIYADVIGCPMKVTAADQTCAFGAGLLGAVCAGKEAGGFSTVPEAQAALCKTQKKEYKPHPASHAVYTELYTLYRTLHDAFSTMDWSGTLGHVMKELIALRDRARHI